MINMFPLINLKDALSEAIKFLTQTLLSRITSKWDFKADITKFKHEGGWSFISTKNGCLSRYQIQFNVKQA